MKAKDLTIKNASKLLREKKISAIELTEMCIKSIEENEPKINAFITVTKELAFNKAKDIDENASKNKNESILFGIPYNLKDVYNVRGVKTTAGSKILENYISPYNSTVYNKLYDNNAILVGKTNCDSFGFGSSTENSAYGITRNPRNDEYVPGGSSGGAAAAVVYGGSIFAIAEDTGGSIRCPASFCGLVGLKPTYGRVSRYGAISYASSYDTVGPITKTVEDCAIVMEVISGKDELDATTMSVKVPNYTKYLNKEIKGYRIGIPDEYFTSDVDKIVKEKVLQAVKELEKYGCEVINISLPYTKYAIAAYYVVGLSEASSNLARFDRVRYGRDENIDYWYEYIKNKRGENFGQEEKRRILIGTYALSSGYVDEYYKKAQKVRERLKVEYLKAFEKVDFIITPTMPITPFKIGENIDDPLKMWLTDAFTVTINPIGIPALSIPCGITDNNLPIGMQIIGNHFTEEKILNLAYHYEQIWNMNQS